MMKKSRLFTTFAVLGSLLFCHSALADGDPVTITVTGNIVASPCQVDPDSVAKTIDLGDIQAADLNAAGSNSTWKTFSITVNNCPAGTSGVTATFNGTPDTDTPDSAYENVGTASNVAVELTGTGGQPFGNGKSFKLDIANGSATWNLQTRVLSAKGGVTPGTVKSVITMSFAYN